MQPSLESILTLVVFILGFYFLAFDLSLTIWTFRDIRSRTQDLFVQLLATFLVLVFNLAGLVLYFILRPGETMMEAYERSLEEETLLREIEARESCPGCKQPTTPDYQFCPYCHMQLRRICARCKHLLQLSWDVCPYCGAEPKIPILTEPKIPTLKED